MLTTTDTDANNNNNNNANTNTDNANTNTDNDNNNDDDGQQLPPCCHTEHEAAGAVFIFYLLFTCMLAPSQAPACEGL